MFDFGILSMNERNLNYIKKLNPKSSINLADDKVETKIFLEQRGVSVPKTLAIISNKKQLISFDFSQVKEDFFVIKPVFGSKGKGILIVENLKNGKYKIGDDIVSEIFLIDHMYDILNGDFSLNYGYDKVLIEEKLIPGNGFERFCKYGLADIRIIVYNLVPVAAMVRMPTKISGGKANLAQGGIGIGIEVGSGIINTIYIAGKVYKNNFPEKYSGLKGFEIPFWDEILYSSSKAQFFVNLGYLALDWVITESGPKILEINARAGLEIQNVCLLPLKNRLDKIKDLKILEPEKGVELAKSLFSYKVTNRFNSSKILYLSQQAKIIFDESEENIIVKVDLNKTKNFISSYLFDLLKKNNFTIKIGENIKFKNLKLIVDESFDNDTLVLGTDIVKDFFIKPEINIIKNELFTPKKVNKNEISLLKIIDEKIIKLDRKVSITNSIKPINFLEQLDKFIEMKGKYNPVFEYDFLSDSRIDKIEKEIISLKESYFKKDLELKSKFADIFLEKIDEISNKLNLIKAYKLQNFEDIEKYNIKLYDKLDKKLVEKSENKLGLLATEDILGEQLDQKYVVTYIKDYLEKNDLSLGVKVILSTSNMSRISLNRKKGKVEVRVSIDGIFREKELDGIIAHEIGVHLIRYINGKKTGWSIFESGTANYLATEEGFAVYNSLKYFPDSYEKNAMYQNYYMLNLAKKLDFQELAEIGFRLKGNDYIKVFKTITRFKKGIQDTGIKNPGAFFSKDKVYLDGYIQVKDWVEKGGDTDKLMIGKIKIEDLDFI
ncbi:MAG: tyrosine/phenylalanine carboxypeptidase domain-containing protein [Candidatus Gracilibacteria bacterium]